MRKRNLLMRFIFLFILVLVIKIPIEEAKAQTTKKIVSVETYDEFWKQLYKLIEEGNPEFTIDIAGKEAEKVKKIIDEDENSPFDDDGGIRTKYVKNNYKIDYLIQYLALQPYYKLELKSPGERCENLEWYVNGFYDIKRIDKDLFFQWGREYYLHCDKRKLWDTLWATKYYDGDCQYYLWDEELQTLQVSVGYMGMDHFDEPWQRVAYNKNYYDRMLKTLNKVEDLVVSWNLENLTDYQRISKVNNFICDTVTYSSITEDRGQTAPDALLDGTAVCGGYADFMDIFLRTMGYEASFINTAVPAHAWNIVKLNGKWYEIDVTWNDDYKGRTRYLLVSHKEMKDHEYMLPSERYQDYKMAETRFSTNSKSKITLAYKNKKKTIKDLELENNYIIVSEGKEKTLTVSVNKTGKKTVFQVNDPSIAEVSSKGVIKGIRRGRTTITVTAGDKTEMCTVMVSDNTLKCYSILFGDNYDSNSKDPIYYYETGSIEIDKNHGYELNIELIPAYTTDKIVSYQSSDESIVTVDKNGLITGHDEGNAFITVTTSDGIEGRCDVYVSDQDYVGTIEQEDDWW